MAAKADTQKTIDFTYDGTTYQILPTAEWPFEALEAMEDGKVLTILRFILLNDGYKALAAKRPNVGQITDFFEAAQKELGIAGN